MSISGGAGFVTFRPKKKLFLALFVSILVVTAIVTIATAVSKKKSSNDNAAHSIVKSSCSATLYPDLCFATISSAPDAKTKIKNPKDVIELVLNLTISAVQSNYLSIKKLISTRGKSLTKREVTALYDCLELEDETLDELFETERDLVDYPSFKKSISQHADDLKSLISAAMTNQETCLDGFSHDRADKKARQAIIDGQMHVFHMCSNALAMIKNLTDTDMASQGHPSSGRRLKEQEETEWPEWLSAGDRRLLQGTTVTPNVTVAADGSGDFLTVSEAVAAAPERSSTRYIIKIKAGVYRENVDVPRRKPNLMFVGDGRVNTIITASRNVVDGSTTFNSATVAAVGDGFLARDITFQNTAGPSKHQAVALRVGSDLSAFYRCDMLAYQDTLYVHSLRQFYSGCLIAGTVDFIFGNAAAVFQDCDIHARRPDPNQRNMVTAQGRDDPNQNTGIVIQKCRIGATRDLEAVKANFPTYLGRPWKQYSRTVILQSVISDVINPAGWFPWNGEFALNTLTYREYQNTGPGANTSSRVTWRGYSLIPIASEAQSYTARNFISGANWLNATGFPFSLDL
ncbi:Pectinesterase/pectinesterase inhibitor 3 [Hibiscus syriacus]|uniref:Pectinesterase n=1 Tax=Hibiscus syriacus TaxID=106335 RepID=A0A6A3A7M4_HIBSY|nr:pectinesterase-like [Hibiscus syriacus]KAE8700364.1 Pectinesterase/pectinesterase inhibitor 3 [Hibiscus syriacus]